MPGQIDISSVIGLMEQAASQNAKLVNAGYSNSNQAVNKALAANGPRLAEEKKKKDAMDKTVREQPGKKAFDSSKMFQGIDITSMIPVSPDAQAAELDKHSADEQVWAMKAYEAAVQPAGGSNGTSR
jgi:hypothetical protein